MTDDTFTRLDRLLRFLVARAEQGEGADPDDVDLVLDGWDLEGAPPSSDGIGQADATMRSLPAAAQASVLVLLEAAYGAGKAVGDEAIAVRQERFKRVRAAISADEKKHQPARKLYRDRKKTGKAGSDKRHAGSRQADEDALELARRLRAQHPAASDESLRMEMLPEVMEIRRRCGMKSARRETAEGWLRKRFQAWKREEHLPKSRPKG